MKVLVTNCTRNSGLSVMRALSAAGWIVEGADDRALAFGLRSRCASTAYARLPHEDDPGFVAALLQLLEQTQPDVLIPTRGIEAACYARESVTARSHCLLAPPEAFEVLNDKVRLLERCAALSIARPQSFSPDEAERYLKAASHYQVVIKPRRDVGGGHNVHIVSEATQILPLYQRVVQAHGGALISEFIPGPTENLRAVQLLFDSASRLIAYFVLRKLRIWPPGVGVTVAAVSTHETALVSSLVPLLKQLQWQGPVDAEFKIDSRDGLAKILEINPRFSGAVHFPIACGVNMPMLYCRAALGEHLAEAHQPCYPAGMHYLDGGRWLAGLLSELRTPGSSRWAVLRRGWQEELRGPRVRSVHTPSDPGPLLAKLFRSRGNA
ncbi:MAG: ATP-grasp domain-containing protein [Terriglobales bacterium]